MHKPDRVCQRMNVEYLILFSEHHCCLFFRCLHIPWWDSSSAASLNCDTRLPYIFSINDTAISNPQSLRSADLMFSITHLFFTASFFLVWISSFHSVSTFRLFWTFLEFHLHIYEISSIIAIKVERIQHNYMQVVSRCQEENVISYCTFWIEYLQIPLHIVTAR